MQHLLGRKPFSIVTGRFAYFRVINSAVRGGAGVKLLPLGPETDWRLRVDDVSRELSARPGLLYVCNPNNPTGQLMLTHDEIDHLADRCQDSVFWIDEAYVQYLASDFYKPANDLIAGRHNVFVNRTFSFAYGLAAARVGYVLGPHDVISVLQAVDTKYNLGSLPEALAVAALRDNDHLPELRGFVATEMARVTTALDVSGVEFFPSCTNFVLARFTDGRRTGRWLADQLLARGIRIRHFEPVGEEHFDEYFRLTLGLEHENRRLCRLLGEFLA